MQKPYTENRFTWLTLGVIAGLAVAGYWPSEPALAEATAGSNQRFAMCTAQTQIASSDAVFVLDFLTGRLMGAAYSPQVNGFSQTYSRNLAKDFGLTEEGQYVMISGYLDVPNRGGVQPSLGGIYVGEMTTGKIHLYGFPYNQGGRPAPTAELVPLGQFAFRQGQ